MYDFVASPTFDVIRDEITGDKVTATTNSGGQTVAIDMPKGVIEHKLTDRDRLVQECRQAIEQRKASLGLQSQNKLSK
jgi:hypothetical protein